MKKIFALLLAVILILSLGACSNVKNNSTNNVSSNTVSTVTTTDDNENTNTEETVGNDPNHSNSTTSTNNTQQTTNTTQNPPTTEKPSTTTKPNKPSSSTTSSTNKPGVTIDVTNNKDDDRVIVNEDTKPVVPSTPTTPSAPSDKKDETSENGNQTTEKDNIIVENIPSNEVIEQPDAPEIKEEVEIITSHTPLSPNYYYQYTSLSSTEKEIYDMITEAIKNTNNVIDVSKKSIKYNAALNLLQKYFSDNPQYFYVSKGTSVTYDPNTNKVFTLIIYYTDGTKTDQFNADGTSLTVTADRNKISQQITTFNNKTKEILKQIPVNASNIEKEKIIHDYIINNVEYDNDILNQSFNFGDTLPSAFNVYGAICEGEAVCEGYAKTFQYLCYGVGINATQVVGTSMNVNHMWNAVRIESAWYQVDVTWDDTSSNELPYYGYYNLTTSEIRKDHTINSTVISVPMCISTNHTFSKDYALEISNISIKPSNIEKVSKYINDNETEEYLILYVNTENVTQNYLKDHIFNPNSTLKNYIAENGYSFDIELRYKILGSYIYVPIKR